MKLIRKLVYSFFILFVIAIASTVIASIIYKDQIINLLITEVNKQIKTELVVDEIDLSLFKGFPNVSVEFKNVKFYSAFENEILLDSKKVYFVLDLFELFNQNIIVDRLEIIDANINVHVNKRGQNNFDVFVINDSSKNSTSLNLESILLVNVGVSTLFEKEGIRNKSHIDRLHGRVIIDKKSTKLTLKSSISMLETSVNQLKWLIGKQIVIDTKNVITKDRVQFNMSSISIEDMFLEVNGLLDFSNNKRIDISLETSNLNFNDFLSVFPKKIKDRLQGYTGEGDIKIKAKLEGSFASKKRLSIISQLRFIEFKINHPKLLYPIAHINVEGELKMKNINKGNSGSFSFTNMKGSINKKDFSASVTLVDFNTPNISGKIAGDLEIPWLLSLVNTEPYNIHGGHGTVHINLSGEVTLNSSHKIERKAVRGKLEFNNVSIDSVQNIPLSLLNGDVIFNEEKLELRNLKINLGESDMTMNGDISFSKEKDKRIYADLTVESNHLNLDEIFRLNEALNESPSTENTKPNYSAVFELHVKSLNALKFRGRNLQINLQVDEKNVRIKSSSADALGGKINFSAAGSKQFNGDYYIEANTKTLQIQIDSLFYVFGNFNQTFITSEAIKGKLDAEVYASMYFGKKWNFKRNLLYADALLRVKEGELTNYEPVMSLSTYLHEEGENLSQLKFSNLENHIIIADDTVFISEMYVGTNVRNIKIGGYHTLSQHIDYRLAVPVINNKDSDNKFGKVKMNNAGQLFFPFRVYGTTTDYKVVYDLKTAGSNFFKGIKNEFKEIGNKKGIKTGQDSLKLEEDEYFDWDSN